MTDKAKIVQGAVVCLIAGGPLMTVEEVRPDGWVDCAWFQDGDLRRDALPADSLCVWVRL